MLHDILFNDRSDDTCKLSDWMAFQIIIQDETRDARKLLSQLGKVNADHTHIVCNPGQIHCSPGIATPWCSGTQVTTDLRLNCC